MMKVLWIFCFMLILYIFQKSGTKYLEENYEGRKKTTTVNGKTKMTTLKHLNTQRRNLFNNMVKLLYHDHTSSIIDGDDKINLDGSLHYTDAAAAKEFFDEAYGKMQEQVSNLVVMNMAATNAVADVNFISDDDE
jgi:hypothetical protein